MQLSEIIQKIHWQEKLIASISIDMLTGLYNRQYFYNKISSLINCCKEKSGLYDENIKALDGFKERTIELLKNKIDIPKNNLLSCSIGIAYTKLNEKIIVSEFIDNADKCLYKAKRYGKGKYVIFEDNEPTLKEI